MQWCSDSFSDLLVGFVNSVKTIDGGTHIDGLKASSHGPCLFCLIYAALHGPHAIENIS